MPVWIRIGLLSFGGPAAQIALMHRELVQERRWVGEARFLHALNFCMLLPGPEATQLATYLGWLMHGVKGGVVAGALFVLPGALVLLLLSLIYAVLGEVPLVAALFFGLKCAVLVLVIEALLRVARRALHGPVPWIVAAVAFVALFFVDVPFPAVVLGAALAGWAAPGAFAPAAHKGEAADAPAALDAMLLADPGRIASLTAAARRAGLVALVLWLWPVALLGVQGGLWGDIAWFFSKMAVVTFGGAYAVLAYVAQEAVEHYRWLSASEMLAGLGLAETTPGPLILVLEFVGFLAGWRHGGLVSGVAAAALTVWVTFVPCFAWIFLGAPFVERLHGHAKLSGALAGVTAAVVGVIANLALWFGLRVIFPETEGPMPVLAGMRWDALALSILAALALFRFRLGVVPTLGVTAVAGLAVSLVL
ncbi:chromate efflux transporter [Roseococcus sp. MDT2-1-1]|uniref:Chromate efflux transporter n=1 Tax=Sabulicella glaciei TaxID=2984948 RepID=A0ABT3NSQ9_9PROT|nr:chromate efflux transporter [Roseococcus sp. MDT2-1-1]